MIDDVKEITKIFKKEKYKNLELCRRIISVTTPTIVENTMMIIKDNENRMKACAGFLYNYQLVEMGINNYKKWSSPINYDEDTIGEIIENLKFNFKQYTNSVEELERIIYGGSNE